MGENKSVQRPMTYAEKLRGISDEALAEIAAKREERKAEIADAMDRRNTRDGATLASRINRSKEREELVTGETEAEKTERLERVGTRLKSHADAIQAAEDLSYRERVTVITQPANEISTKDLRSPKQRRLDFGARQSSMDDGWIYAE